MTNYRSFAAAFLAAVSPVAAHAQGVGNRTSLDEILVIASVGAPTAPTASSARKALEAIPGAIGFVEAASFSDDFTQSLGDALNWTPGVFADTSAQRESRISIRGSGLNSGFERRGITVYRDGVPITRASGSTEFQEVDPLSIAWLEVYKGANGLRYGSASLGGAINIVSPTGLNLQAPFSLRIEGGSFDTLRASASAGGEAGIADYWAGATWLNSNGYRDHSAVNSVYGFGNLGLRLSSRVETRFYLTALEDRFELAGSLSREDALENPRIAARPTMFDPGPEADDWDRNLSVVRIANRTAVDLGAVQLEGGLWYSWRGLDHAITRFAGIIDQAEDELGLFAEVSGETDAIAWRIGAQANRANNSARTWANQLGERGPLRSQSDQDSANLAAYGEADVALAGSVRLIAGGQFSAARRDVDAILNAVSGRESYSQFNPRLGLLWSPLAAVQLFANANRSFEPPSIADLTAGGAFPFAPLDPQSAWTVEAGGRGELGRAAFDVAIYRSWVKNEFIDLLAANGRSSFTANADHTSREGLEAGLDLFLIDGADDGALDLVFRQVWTWQNFRFDDDPRFGRNRLAGVPSHVLGSELRLDGASGWYVGANVRVIPKGPWIDYANTERAPGYDLWGLTAGWTWDDRIRLFGSVENLFDTRFISNVSTTANQAMERAAAYTPGQGRAVFVGASAAF